MFIMVAAGIAVLGIMGLIYFGAWIQPRVGMTPEERESFTRFSHRMALVWLITCMAVSAGILFGYPQYNVWRQAKDGEAALAKAEQDRQIIVQEALAKRESAEQEAKANQLIGESMREYPESLTYRWIEMLKDTQNQVIYMPTKDGIPITEAGRIKQVDKSKEK